MHNQEKNSPDFTLGLALFLLIWPIFNEFITEILLGLGYAQDLGGGILRFLVSALSMLLGAIFCVIFLFSRKEHHTPLQGKRIAFWVAGLTLASTICFNVIWAQAGFFCKVGSCPSMN
ncbi:hypothetical protein AAKU55_000202 [Oxalobacteraceae bacterium GrIS 1.11]